MLPYTSPHSLAPRIRKSLLGLGLAAAATLWASTPQAHAVLIAYEGFDYTATDLNGTGSGTGWGTNLWGTNTQFSTGTGLSYSNEGGVLDSTGNAVEHTGSGVTNIMRTLENPIARTNGTEIWVSFVSDQSSSAYHNLTLFNGGTEVMSFGAVHVGGSTFTSSYALRKGSAFTGENVPVVTAAAEPPQLLVMQLVYNAGGSTTARLYLNPTLGAVPNDPIVEQTFSSGVGVNGFDRVRIEMGVVGSASTGNFMDEIRIGTTAADIMPVPETNAGLLVLSSLMTLFLFRRHRNS